MSGKETKKSNVVNRFFDYIALVMCSAIFLYIGRHMHDKLDYRAETKPYVTFAEFFPFYMSQHAETTCRRLHVVGTSIFALGGVMDPKILLPMLPAVLVGLGMCYWTADISHGFYEFIVMLTVLMGSSRVVNGDYSGVKKMFSFVLIGYGFAWVGHFIFEKNTPATFIYPSFSLLGDFRLFFETITMQREF